MRDKGLETLVMMTGEVVDAETAKRGTHSTQTVFVDEGQLPGGIVNG